MLDGPIGFYNSNDGSSILGLGCTNMFVSPTDTNLADIQSFIDSNSGEFMFSAFSYDLKNGIEKLESRNKDNTGFPETIIWTPRIVVEIIDEKWSYLQGERNPKNDSLVQEFLSKQKVDFEGFKSDFIPRTSKQKYIQDIIGLKKHIQRGDIYEVNYCQEYYLTGTTLHDPVSLYFAWNEKTKAPYSCYVQFESHVLISGSPENFIEKNGNKLSSSPIKGTRRRGNSPEEDERLKNELLNDPKETSENVMIVDLVRNDLSRIAAKNSVQVEELFGVYSFETVHQLISKVVCEIRKDISFTDILRATFPMGSMTGAPKISAMNLIDEYEDFARGIYSGSVGFIKPNGDFNFNVIIRSLVANLKTNYLSCSVGGAITHLSDPEKEYEECEVKVKGILNSLHAQA